MISCGDRCDIGFTLHSLMVPDHGTKVEANQKTFHPELKTHVLGFQPNDTSIPSWIKPNTDRRSRATPLIVHGRNSVV